MGVVVGGPNRAPSWREPPPLETRTSDIVKIGTRRPPGRSAFIRIIHWVAKQEPQPNTNPGPCDPALARRPAAWAFTLDGLVFLHGVVSCIAQRRPTSTMAAFIGEIRGRRCCTSVVKHYVSYHVTDHSSPPKRDWVSSIANVRCARDAPIVVSQCEAGWSWNIERRRRFCGSCATPWDY